MKHRILAILGVISLSLVLLLGSVKASWAVQRMADFATNYSPRVLLAQSQWYTPPGIPATGCQLRPKWSPPPNHIETTFVPGQLTLARFRQASVASSLTSVPDNADSDPARVIRRRPGDPGYSLQRYPSRNYASTYTPKEIVALANPTNFGERYLQDVNGQPVNNAPMIVIHETVIPAWQTVKVFQTYHPRDEDQASYHALIKRDGTIYYTVPPDKRAFGAGDSVFNGETVKTNRLYSPSVNNFAYHISFESPPDGRGNGNYHSGYTDLQYESLGWLASRTGIPDSRISYHKSVDRSGTRKDPRSFDVQKFQQAMSRYPKVQEIAVGCTTQATIPPQSIIPPQPLSPQF